MPDSTRLATALSYTFPIARRTLVHIYYETALQLLLGHVIYIDVFVSLFQIFLQFKLPTDYEQESSIRHFWRL